MFICGDGLPLNTHMLDREFQFKIWQPDSPIDPNYSQGVAPERTRELQPLPVTLAPHRGKLKPASDRSMF